MKLVIRRRAAKLILETADWIEAQNTTGAGDRWLEELMETLHENAKSLVKYAICKNEALARLEYHCFVYRAKWIVAYRIMGDRFVIFRFIYGAKLK